MSPEASAPRRIMVLGAGGFLGTQVRHLLERIPLDVRCVYVSGRDPVGPGAESARARWIRLPLGTATGEDIGRLVRGLGPDAIINCAGAVTGSTPTLRRANVGLVAHLLAATSGTGVRLVQLGSAAEYGPTTPFEPVAEDAPCDPLTEYGRTKLAATDAVCAASVAGQVEGVVLRVFNPVGAGCGDQNLAGRAARMMGEAIERGADSIELGALDTFRDYVDARDVAEAALMAATQPLEAGTVLNVGRGEATQSRELILRLARTSGFDGTICEVASPTVGGGPLAWQQADVRRIARTMGWVPRRTLDDAVRELWESLPVGATAASRSR
jgi:NDP-hexose 4-ketoreductase